MKYKTLIFTTLIITSLNVTAETKYFAQISKEITKKSVDLLKDEVPIIFNSCNEKKRRL